MTLMISSVVGVVPRRLCMDLQQRLSIMSSMMTGASWLQGGVEDIVVVFIHEIGIV
jgi:hypothetical protein